MHPSPSLTHTNVCAHTCTPSLIHTPHHTTPHHTTLHYTTLHYTTLRTPHTHTHTHTHTRPREVSRRSSLVGHSSATIHNFHGVQASRRPDVQTSQGCRRRLAPRTPDQESSHTPATSTRVSPAEPAPSIPLGIPGTGHGRAPRQSS